MANLTNNICVVKLSSYRLQKRQRIVITFAFFFFIIFLSGCMTFNGAELPLRQLPKYDSFRPLISTEIGEIKLLYNGADGLKPTMSGHKVGKRALKAVLRRWKAKKLIDDYDPPEKLNRKPDYKLKIKGTQNEQGDFFSAYKSGYTFFLFPSSYSLNWEWTFQLINLKTNEQFEVSTKNSVMGRVHLIFLPLFPFSIVGQRNADNMLSCYVYDEFKKQGAWHFSTKQADDFL